MFHAQKRSGHVSYQTKMVSQWILPALGKVIHTNLELKHIDWAEGFFFVHTIRDTKHLTQHTRNHNAATRALAEYLEDAHIPSEIMETDDWWIDIGVEFSSPDDAYLQWMTSSHSSIIKEVL